MSCKIDYKATITEDIKDTIMGNAKSFVAVGTNKVFIPNGQSSYVKNNAYNVAKQKEGKVLQKYPVHLWGPVVSVSNVSNGAEINIHPTPQLIKSYEDLNVIYESPNEFVFQGEVYPTLDDAIAAAEEFNEDPTKFQKDSFMPLDDLDMNKVTEMQAKFRQAGIQVTVKLDETMEEAGKVLGTADLKKAGYQPDDKVIVLNPNKIYADTVIHEFGHLFIELVGGISNPMVQVAISKLEGTTLWNEVADKYPELTPNELGKEVLATAMGHEGTAIFDNKVDNSFKEQIRRIINKILAVVKKMVGIEPSTAKELARQMLEGNITQGAQELVIPTTKRQKIKQPKKNVQQVIKDIVDDQANFTFDPVFHVYTYKGKQAKQSVTGFIETDVFNEQERSRAEAIKQLPPDATDEQIDQKQQEILIDWDQRALIGDKVHSLLEKYLKKEMTFPDKLPTSGPISELFAVQGAYDNFKTMAKKLVAKTKGQKVVGFLNEVMLYDPENNLAGTCDFMIFLEDGSVIYKDFKSSVKNFHKKYNSYDKKKHALQVLTYGKMVENSFGIPSGESKFHIEPVQFQHKNGKVTYFSYEGEIDIMKHSEVYDDAATGKPGWKSYVNSLFASHNDKADQEKALDEEAALTEKELTKLEELKNQLLNTLRIKMAALAKKKDVAANKKELGLLSQIELEIQEKEGIEGIMNFMLNAKEKLVAIQKQLDNYTKYPERIDAKQLDIIKTYLDSFRDLRDIDAAIVHKDIVGIRRDFSQMLKNMLDTLEDRYHRMALDHVAGFLAAETEDIWTGNFKLRFEKEFDALHGNNVKGKKQLDGKPVSDEVFNMRKKEYIRDKIMENREAIEITMKQNIIAGIEERQMDIGLARALLYDSNLINDKIINAVSRLLDQADNEVKNYTIDLHKRVHAAMDRELERRGEQSSAFYNNAEKFFDPYLDKRIKDKSLTGYMVGEYSAEYLFDRADMLDEASKLETEGKTKEAQNLRNQWFTKNTVKDKDGKSRPADHYKNDGRNGRPDWNKIKEDPTYKYVYDSFKEQDAMLLSPKDKLIANDANMSEVEWIKLPSIGKSLTQKMVEAGALTGLYEAARTKFKQTGEDEEFGDMENSKDAELQLNKEYIKGSFDISGQERRNVPVPFRGNLGGRNTDMRTHVKNLNFDLFHAVVLNGKMAKNFQEKQKIEADIHLIQDLYQAGKYQRTTGLRRVMHKPGENVDAQFLPSEGSAGAKMLESIIRERLYGIQVENLGDITIGNKTANINKMLGAVGTWTSDTMMMFNYLAGASNWTFGHVNDVVEALGGTVISATNLKNAHAKYIADTKGILGDMERNHARSKTNLLLEKFEVLHEFDTHFLKVLMENNRFKQVFKKGTGYALQAMGEHHIQAIVMYAVMDSIKMKNAKGELIDKEGKVVEDPSKAMTFDESFDIKLELTDGTKVDPKDQAPSNIAKMHHLVRKDFIAGNTLHNLDIEGAKESQKFKQYKKNNPKATTKQKEDKAREIAFEINEERVQHRIGELNSSLHYGRKKNMLQRHAIGKMLFQLRGWLVRSFLRRWKGAQYVGDNYVELAETGRLTWNSGTEQFEEGMYTTTVRFIYNMFKQTDGFKKAVLMENWKNLTDYERANITKTAYEMLIQAAFALTATLLAMVAYGMDDDEDKELMYFLASITRRTYSEIAIYNPLVAGPISEGARILKSPAASLSMLTEASKALYYLSPSYLDEGGFGWERYERTHRKGQLKFWKPMGNMFPGIKHLNRNMEDTYGYLSNTFSW